MNYDRTTRLFVKYTRNCLIGKSVLSMEASLRIALVGFSSPVAYDYRHQATKAPADQMSSPNPILFGGSAVMLLFDEIWFVTRSLCPESMRGLAFVRFLDEDGGLSADVLGRAISEFAAPKVGLFLHSLDMDFTARVAFQKVKDGFLTKNDFGWDNHTHALNVLGHRFLGNSGAEHTLAVDKGLKQLLKEPNLEVIYNPFWFEGVESETNSLAEIGVSNELMLKRVPNPFDMRGPIVDDIYKWRENNFIGDYRSWISSQTLPRDLTKIKELSEQIEKDTFDAMRRAFLEKTTKSRMYKSMAKSVLGEIATHLLPGSTVLFEFSKELREEAKVREERWRAFLLSLDSSNEAA